jgi:F-box interacting protein
MIETDYKINKQVVSGFGFSVKSKKFKIVRLVHRGGKSSNNNNRGSRRFPPEKRMLEVYTIGDDSWKSIGPAPKYPEQSFPSFSTFFNGVMHWVCDDKNGPGYIITFDFESEKFGTLPPPHRFVIEPVSERNKIMIGVLGEFLCLSHNLELWVMKKYGVQESWSKVYAIDGLPHGSHQAMKNLSRGKVLIKYREEHHFDDHIISYDHVANNCKEFEVLSQLWSFSAIPHTPNFMKFTDALKGD